ncbi:histidinol dehydrogenase [Luethyella okanaganae]|uniref:Histidinol dehydrogenase n=1 Tax=Luethyella okanaganae TaxID=69372 RepID=A0ABW1VE29_9MICO
MTTSPIRERGRWADMSAEDRADLNTRGIGRIFDPELRASVLEILEDVRGNGDAAMLRALAKFDKVEVDASGIRVNRDEFDQARAEIGDEMLAAIRESIAFVRRYNERLVAEDADWQFETAPGVVVGERTSPIESAGLFIPAGKGSFPSVMVQLGTPAVVAGVQKIAVVTPPVPGSGGKVDPAILVVADELGITDVFRANGPAGIGALAFGTETVPAVRKIVGPGSPPVAVAQIEVQRFGVVSNMLLGPSESLILADDSADPRLLAADLLNEAEHGPDSSSVLVTTSAELLAAVQIEITEQLAALPSPRDEYARIALHNGGAVLVDSIEEGAEVANAYAPEHMQLVASNEDYALDLIHDAAEILVGQHTTVSMANFALGCPAALPTSGYAKVSSGITAHTFRKKRAVAKSTQEGLRALAPTVLAYTAHEGFPAHGNSVSIRL